MAKRNIKIVCYDLPTISRFCRSVAFMAATVQHTKIRWEEYRDSKVLNAIHTVFFWKGHPGYAVIDHGDPQQVMAKTDELHARYLSRWVDMVATEGPARGHNYLNALQGIRDMSQNDLDNLIRNANEITAQAISETNEGIRNLSTIKMQAKIGLALIGAVTGVGFAAGSIGMAGTGGLMVMGTQAGAGTLGFAATSMASSVAFNVVENWEEGASAQIAAISTTAQRSTGQAIGDYGAETIMRKAQANSTQAARIMQQAEAQVRQYSMRTGAGFRPATQQANLARAQAAAQTAARQGMVAQANNMARNAVAHAMVALPVVFAAREIVDAIDEHRRTVASTY